MFKNYAEYSIKIKIFNLTSNLNLKHELVVEYNTMTIKNSFADAVTQKFWKAADQLKLNESKKSNL